VSGVEKFQGKRFIVIITLQSLDFSWTFQKLLSAACSVKNEDTCEQTIFYWKTKSFSHSMAISRNNKHFAAGNVHNFKLNKLELHKYTDFISYQKNDRE
jgi:hypothetical protein